MVLLIGADGIHSRVRERLFGPENARFTGNARRVAEPSFDHNEELTIERVPEAEIPRLIREGRIDHALAFTTPYTRSGVIAFSSSGAAPTAPSSSVLK